eukprot:scaffold311122_cov24-Tisochrysis_lutea.AAC.1
MNEADPPTEEKQKEPPHHEGEVTEAVVESGGGSWCLVALPIVALLLVISLVISLFRSRSCGRT